MNRSFVRTAAVAFFLLSSLSACEPLPTSGLTDLIRVGDPSALVDAVAILGRTIDLSRFDQVRRAVGSLRGVSVKEAQQRDDRKAVFTRYTLPMGEIVYNPDGPRQYYLIVSLRSCVPLQVIRERLRRPEFSQASPVAVALYTDVRYADRPLIAFTYHQLDSDCVSSFGITQREDDPWHIH